MNRHDATPTENEIFLVLEGNASADVVKAVESARAHDPAFTNHYEWCATVFAATRNEAHAIRNDATSACETAMARIAREPKPATAPASIPAFQWRTATMAIAALALIAGGVAITYFAAKSNTAPDNLNRVAHKSPGSAQPTQFAEPTETVPAEGKVSIQWANGKKAVSGIQRLSEPMRIAVVDGSLQLSSSNKKSASAVEPAEVAKGT